MEKIFNYKTLNNKYLEVYLKHHEDQVMMTAEEMENDIKAML